MTDDKKIILCIDDDKVILTALKNMLEEEYTVNTFRSGKEAINHIVNAEALPDLILLDIIMPEMDGWETLSHLRGISILNKIPVFFITSLNDESVKEKAAAMGGTDLLKKPIDKLELLAKIKLAITKQNT